MHAASINDIFHALIQTTKVSMCFDALVKCIKPKTCIVLNYRALVFVVTLSLDGCVMMVL